MVSTRALRRCSGCGSTGLGWVGFRDRRLHPVRALGPASERGHGFALEAAGEVLEDPGRGPGGCPGEVAEGIGGGVVATDGQEEHRLPPGVGGILDDRQRPGAVPQGCPPGEAYGLWGTP